jgi:hypothetical protein
LKSKCKDLHAENCQLEKAVAVREDYFSKLKIHQEGALQTHERLLKADPMYKAAVNELEESLEIRKEYADAETRTKMSYRKFMLAAAEMLEKCNNENLKDFVSSSIIGLLDGEKESKSTLTFDDSKDTVNRAVAHLDAKPARCLETIAEELVQSQNTLNNDDNPDNELSVKVVASSPPSPSPRSPRISSSSTPRSPRKQRPRTTLSPRTKCVI